MADDLQTRVTLLEKTAVIRDELATREDRLLQRFEAIMDRYVDRLSDDQEHRFKVFGHEIADQLRGWAAKIHSERDAILDKRDAEIESKLKAEAPKAPGNPFTAFLFRNWVWFGVIAIIIWVLEPDAIGSLIRLAI